MGRKRKHEPRRYCRHCGAILHRKRWASALEDMGAFLRRRYCDRACMAQAMVQPDVTRSAYLWRARRLRKPACERCSSTVNLHVHHRDGSWRNNCLENLETVCASCHLIGHWKSEKHAWKRRVVRAEDFAILLSLCEDQIERDEGFAAAAGPILIRLRGGKASSPPVTLMGELRAKTPSPWISSKP